MLTMKNVSVQKCMYVLSIILLVTLFAACSDPSSASGVTPTPTTADTTPTPTTAATATSAANQPATPTSVTGTGKAPTAVAKATSATTANQPATPTPVIETGTDFQSFTGEDFTVLYPAKWQKTHKTSSGPVAKNQPL